MTSSKAMPGAVGATGAMGAIGAIGCERVQVRLGACRCVGAPGAQCVGCARCGSSHALHVVAPAARIACGSEFDRDQLAGRSAFRRRRPSTMPRIDPREQRRPQRSASGTHCTLPAPLRTSHPLHPSRTDIARPVRSGTSSNRFGTFRPHSGHSPGVLQDESVGHNRAEGLRL